MEAEVGHADDADPAPAPSCPSTSSRRSARGRRPRPAPAGRARRSPRPAARRSTRPPSIATRPASQSPASAASGGPESGICPVQFGIAVIRKPASTAAPEAEQHLVPMPGDGAVGAGQRQARRQRRDPERHRDHGERAGPEEERPEAIGEQYRPGPCQAARDAVPPRGLVRSGCRHRPSPLLSPREPWLTPHRMPRGGRRHDRCRPAEERAVPRHRSRRAPEAIARQATERPPRRPARRCSSKASRRADHFYLAIEGRLKVTMIIPEGKQVLVQPGQSGRPLRPRLRPGAAPSIRPRAGPSSPSRCSAGRRATGRTLLRGPSARSPSP